MIEYRLSIGKGVWSYRKYTDSIWITFRRCPWARATPCIEVPVWTGAVQPCPETAAHSTVSIAQSRWKKPLESRSIFSSDLLDLWQGLSHEITKYFQIFKINWAIKQLVPLDTMFLVLKWTSTLFCSFQVFCAYTKVDKRASWRAAIHTQLWHFDDTKSGVIF